MTLTKEQIEIWKRNNVGGAPTEISVVEFHKLCDLALIGLAVQPRPIEEAPRDGTQCLVFIAGFDPTIAHFEPECGWVVLQHDMSIVVLHKQPGYFIPLSALPKP